MEDVLFQCIYYIGGFLLVFLDRPGGNDPLDFHPAVLRRQLRRLMLGQGSLFLNGRSLNCNIFPLIVADLLHLPHQQVFITVHLW